MIEFLESVSKITVLVFVVSCMAAAGLGLSIREVIAPLSRVRLVLLALIANFAIAPIIAFALTESIPLERPFAIGLLLLGGAAGAPFLPKLAELARGDSAFSVGLMLLLMVGSVVFMPIVLPLLIPGLSPDPWPLLRPLLLTMLLPLMAGMGVKSRAGRWAARLRPTFAMVSNAGLILTLVLLIGLNSRAMLETFGTGAVGVAVVFVALTLAVGYALGGPAMSTRSVLGLGTGQRNIPAALLVATENFPDSPGVVVMLLVSTFAGLVPLVGVARWIAGRSSRPATSGKCDSQPGGLPPKPVGATHGEL